MNEQQFGKQVRQVLNRGLTVHPDVATRLARARHQALERQRPEPAPALAWADNLFGGIDSWGDFALRVLVPMALLVAGLAGIWSWEQNQRIAEVEEIDAQLLTDDLPVEAYLDRGFQNWLKKRAAEQ